MPVLDVEPAEPALKKKKLSRLEKRHEVRVRAAAGGGNDSDSAESQAAVTGRRVLIGREMMVYLAEQGQLDVDAFNRLGFWNRRGTDSVCRTTSTVTSPAEVPYLAFIARLYYGIEATSCQAERNFSALAHLIDDVRSRMLARKVERMMFIRLNRHLIDEVRDSDATVAQARARVAMSTQIFLAAQEERPNIRLTLPYRYHKWSCGSYPSSAYPCSVFSRHLVVVVCFVTVLGVILLRYQCDSISFLSFAFHEAVHIHSR